MRFSDMMGSGEDQALKSSEKDSAVNDALAPYLDAPNTDAPKPADTAVAVEAAVDAAVEASREAAAEAEAATQAPSAHTVAAVFPVVTVPAESITPAPQEPAVDTAPVAALDATASVDRRFHAPLRRPAPHPQAAVETAALAG